MVNSLVQIKVMKIFKSGMYGCMHCPLQKHFLKVGKIKTIQVLSHRNLPFHGNRVSAHLLPLLSTVTQRSDWLAGAHEASQFPVLILGLYWMGSSYILSKVPFIFEYAEHLLK